MRVLLGVRKSVVHPVHDSISPRHEVRRALHGIAQKVEKSLPINVHREHFMRSVSVVKEGLQENGAKPVRRKKTQYDHFEKFCILQDTVIYAGDVPLRAKGRGSKKLPSVFCLANCQQSAFFTPAKQIFANLSISKTQFDFVFGKQYFLKFHKKIMQAKHFLILLLPFCLLFACSPSKKFGAKNSPLSRILAGLERDSIGRAVLKNKDRYEIQIIYTQIDRDAQGKPQFTSFWHNVDSTRYFYPASTVKMPLALLALEKINHLRRSGYPRLTRNTFYGLDSLRAFQQRYTADPAAPNSKPSIAHDVRQIFVVSDNLAYNHLFEFLGREYINRALREKGYSRTGIVHRFNYPGRDNRYASPITFYDATSGIFKLGERFDEHIWENPQHSTRKGKGWYNAADSLVHQPFEMKTKNWFALTDMEKMLRAVLFPDAVPEQNRFSLTGDDYKFLWHYMGIFPRECDYPKYDTTYHDGYVKFFLFGDSKEKRDGSVRSFNKVGEAYGTLTDVAYIVDFEKNVEFILAATILCNSDGIFNDDMYDYDKIGFPFLAKLGRAVYDFELKRERKMKPDLGKLREALR